MQHHNQQTTDRLIRVAEASTLTGVSKSTFWAWVKSGKAPKPTKISEKVTVWRMSDIQAFIVKITESAA